MRVGDDVELEIERLASGGDGIARLADGRIVFVTDALVGDQVVAELTQLKRSFGRARTTSVVRPSPHRRTSPCPVSASCGGCRFQDAEPEAAWAWKRDAAVSGVLRAGRPALASLDEVPIVEHRPGPVEGYRRRARLHVRDGLVGHYGRRSHEIISATACRVLHPALVAAVRRLSEGLPPSEATFYLDLADPAGDGVVMRIDSRDEDVWSGWAEARIREGTIVGASVGVGDASFEVRRGPLSWRLPAGSFTQANPIVEAVLCDIVEEELALSAGALLVELFSGHGALSLPAVVAQPGVRLEAYDLAAPALAAGRAAAKHAGVDERVRFASLDLFDEAPSTLAEASHVLLDPPRTGARYACRALARIKPRQIVYVSCDASTLGRDVGVLIAGGYRLHRLHVLDMMPSTSHVELVAVLSP